MKKCFGNYNKRECKNCKIKRKCSEETKLSLPTNKNKIEREYLITKAKAEKFWSCLNKGGLGIISQHYPKREELNRVLK